jgi:aerotaxis receptor
VRINLPVTNREYFVQDRETIVSKTDLNGNISYVNQDFIRINGYSEEELLGAPQNILRHPDMPEEVFADFWQTLKAGKTWTGLVKNRCKNGDHYWIEAIAGPLIKNSKVIGYTSIRGKPDREQVRLTEAAYRAIKAGNSGLTVRAGQVVQRSALCAPALLTNVSINAKLFFIFMAFFILFASNALLIWRAPGLGGVWALASSVLGALFAVVSGLLLHGAVVKPLKQTLHDINRISSGDLSGKIAIHGDDELGMVTQALRILQINVKLLVGQIQQVTEIINSSTSKIVTDDDAALCSESCPCKHSVSELAAARQKKAASACHH